MFKIVGEFVLFQPDIYWMNSNMLNFLLAIWKYIKYFKTSFYFMIAFNFNRNIPVIFKITS